MQPIAVFFFRNLAAGAYQEQQPAGGITAGCAWPDGQGSWQKVAGAAKKTLGMTAYHPVRNALQLNAIGFLVSGKRATALCTTGIYQWCDCLQENRQAALCQCDDAWFIYKVLHTAWPEK